MLFKKTLIYSFTTIDYNPKQLIASFAFIIKIYKHTTFNKHQWSSGRIVPCHGTDPGSIPGWCISMGAVMIFVSG